MNILDKLIDIKESIQNITLNDLKTALSELILYEKLARSDKFKNRKNEIWKKKTPLLYSDNSNDQLLIHTAIKIYNEIAPTKFEHDRLLKIISDSHHMEVYHITKFTYDITDYFILRHDKQAVIITLQDGAIILYKGEIDVKNKRIDHFTYKNVVIKHFSFVGENSYPFGTIDNEPIKLLKKTLTIGNTKYTITDGEHNKLFMLRDLNYLSELIIKYYKS